MVLTRNRELLESLHHLSNPLCPHQQKIPLSEKTKVALAIVGVLTDDKVNAIFKETQDSLPEDF